MLNPLGSFYNKSEHVVAGVMSGTSCDGIDVAICSLNSKDRNFKLEYFYSKEYSKEFRDKLLRMSNASVKDLAEMHYLLGSKIADVCNSAIAKSGLSHIDLISSHGHTVYHHSRKKDALKVTLQIGDGDVISYKTKTTVISELRNKDIIAGGEGAPLTPYADTFFFGFLKPVAIINIGGISNITYLTEDINQAFGFDLGPGNSPIDKVVNYITSGTQNFDYDGEIAAKGKVAFNLVEKWYLEDSYFNLPHPKSTGTESYGEDYTKKLIEDYSTHIVDSDTFKQDILATVTYFVSYIIAKGINSEIISKVILAGGGAYNKTLVENIKNILNKVPITTTLEYGMSPKSRETIAFALLGYHSMLGIPINIKSVTGAMTNELLGKISFPKV
jgi:anhydro-N-acetylmuramic acid kinase